MHIIMQYQCAWTDGRVWRISDIGIQRLLPASVNVWWSNVERGTGPNLWPLFGAIMTEGNMWTTAFFNSELGSHILEEFILLMLTSRLNDNIHFKVVVMYNLSFGLDTSDIMSVSCRSIKCESHDLIWEKMSIPCKFYMYSLTS